MIGASERVLIWTLQVREIILVNKNHGRRDIGIMKLQDRTHLYNPGKKESNYCATSKVHQGIKYGSFFAHMAGKYNKFYAFEGFLAYVFIHGRTHAHNPFNCIGNKTYNKSIQHFIHKFLDRRFLHRKRRDHKHLTKNENLNWAWILKIVHTRRETHSLFSFI